MEEVGAHGVDGDEHDVGWAGQGEEDGDRDHGLQGPPPQAAQPQSLNNSAVESRPAGRFPRRDMTLSAGLILALAAAPPASPSPAAAMPPRMAELVKQLKDPDWDTRMEAATSLGAFGPAAAPALPNLIEALKDPVPAVRMKAVDAIMFMR